MIIQVDTNILIRPLEPNHRDHAAAAAAVAGLRKAGHRLSVVPQNFYEFWVVVTRPTNSGGIGLTPAQATSRISDYRTSFTLLRDTAGVFDKWLDLVTTYDCKGKPAHDARIVAAMLTHGVTTLLTLNPSDFQRYPEIQIIDPRTYVVSG